MGRKTRKTAAGMNVSKAQAEAACDRLEQLYHEFDAHIVRVCGLLSVEDSAILKEAREILKMYLEGLRDKKKPSDIDDLAVAIVAGACERIGWPRTPREMMGLMRKQVKHMERRYNELIKTIWPDHINGLHQPRIP